jgi:hypothetical protein
MYWVDHALLLGPGLKDLKYSSISFCAFISSYVLISTDIFCSNRNIPQKPNYAIPIFSSCYNKQQLLRDVKVYALHKSGIYCA